MHCGPLCHCPAVRWHIPVLEPPADSEPAKAFVLAADALPDAAAVVRLREWHLPRSLALLACHPEYSPVRRRRAAGYVAEASAALHFYPGPAVQPHCWGYWPVCRRPVLRVTDLFHGQ